MASKNPKSAPAGADDQQQVSAPPPGGAERTRTRRAYSPRTDIYETDDGLVLLIDLPGVAANAAEVTLEQNVLTIRGRTEERAPEGFSPVYQEYEPGDFERAFTLSDAIDGERIEAQVHDGVLRLFLPKAGPARTQRIQVRAG
jgi:HSP20 family protein